MASTQEVIDSIIYSLKSSDAVTDDASFIDHEPDITTEAIKLPVIQVSPITKIRISDENSDFVGIVEGDTQNTYKRVYEILYRLEVTISAWTAEGSQYAGRGIQESITSALFKHESSGMDEPLVKPDGTQLDGVWRFAMQSGEQNDNLNTTPTLRKWEKSVTVSMSETFESAEKEGTASSNETVSVN